ncbi:C-type mannose receptor 2-like [Melanotaenia boesemani]|uniref:C-type mannose receptor 2-like n=1 Tax=Melanotaenia boesemani TaxID=1250792 RepID=UPI001C05663C|nr:C-type mannose receptor 2-like [Melanotaenia boesemani]
MKKTLFVIFLLTGFCVTSVSSAWYWYSIKKNMTFENAYNHCLTDYGAFLTMQTSSTNNYLSNFAKYFTDKVWVGLLARTLPWTGMDGQPAEYFNWKFDEPNGGIDELCATMAYDGEWQDLTCSSHRQSVCSDGSHYYITETEMTWMDAVANCEAKNSSLVQIQNSTMNNEIMNLLSSATEVWIGLNTSVDWYWADTGKSATFLNWQEGQPDNLSGNESCAAMETENGTWTDEQCDELYYFFCKEQVTGGVGSTAVETKVQKSKQTVVKLKIQTRVNMEDPAASAILEEQLRAMLAKQGVTDFRLTWKKLPEKETQETKVNFQMATILHLILLISGFRLVTCCNVTRNYYYINLKMNWTDAQHYCRTKYTDLAVIDNMDDVERLIRPTADNSLAWIGLYDNPQSWKGIINNEPNSWKWSTLGESSTLSYQNWAAGKPNYFGGIDTCVKMETSGKWNDETCSLKLYIVCYQETNSTGQKNYTLLKIALTWEDAQTHCREHYTDLAVIGNEQENSQVQSVKGINVVWIGLNRIPWIWSDKSNSSFRNWYFTQPNNFHGDEYCVVETKSHFWHDDSCGTERPFWCYEAHLVHHPAIKVKRVVGMTFQSHADLSDSALNAQLLQQISEFLGKEGWTNVTLQWKIPPRINNKRHVISP